MGEETGHYFLYNESQLDVREFYDYSGIMDRRPTVYEVIRVEEGIPLFVEDYLDRLRNSYQLLGRPMPLSEATIRQRIASLIQVNEHVSGPVKLVFGAGPDDYFLAFLIKPHVPNAEAYETGVHTILMEATRENPNIKIWNNGLREKSTKLLAGSEAYEAILVNPAGFITEGSRSNIFFIKGDRVFTTPAEAVLPGITRKKVLEVCAREGVTVELKKIAVAELAGFDSCFLTGTARKIVPIKSIGTVKFQTGTAMLNALSGYFEAFVEAYLQQQR